MRLRLFGPLLLLASLAAGFEATWDTILQLTTNPQNQSLSYGYQRSIACDPHGNVHVCWLDQRSVPYQLWYRRFDRAAGVWRPETVLTNRSANCQPPAVAADGQGNLHVFWHLEANPYGIWYKRFDAGTSIWRPDSLFENATAQLTKYYPSVSCRPGSREVHVVWYGSPDTGGSYQVFHRELKPDSGWRRPVQLSSFVASHDQASLTVDSAGNVCAVWCCLDSTTETRQVFSRRRIGGVWQPVELVSNMPDRATQYAPCVVAGSGGVWHFVWHGRTTQEFNHRIRYRNRSPSGWSDIVVVSSLPDEQQESPSVCFRPDGDCHVVWRGQTQSSSVYQLFYACRESNGRWTTPLPLTQRSTGNVSRPAITADPDTCLHAIWFDASSGNQDVYYLRGHERGTGTGEVAAQPRTRAVVRPSLLVGPYCRIVTTEPAELTLSDASGRVLRKTRTAGDFTLDCRRLPAGVYFLALRYPDSGELLKLVRP
ncbi:MAG: T9SS type A sorting domain-containing protein [candidate division WOR-3 bacterium]